MAPTAEEVVALSPTTAPPAREASRGDVERYLRLRAASRRLNHDLLAIVPPHALDHIGAAIGILCGRTFVFETESVAAVLADCCIFDWLEGGETAPERYARETPPLEGTYEHELLEAMLGARYDVIDVVERRPGVGVRASSLVDGKDVRLLDVDLGERTGAEGTALAARLLPVGEFWMTSAPALEIARPLAVAALRTFARTAPSRADGPAGPLEDREVVLTIVRAGLEARRGRRARAEGALGLGRTA
ncbi:MAG: hypothetical protein ACYTKD_05865 [Planctomycetota bacterium]|jgi:hypothetical protein